MGDNDIDIVVYEVGDDFWRGAEWVAERSVLDRDVLPDDKAQIAQPLNESLIGGGGSWRRRGDKSDAWDLPRLLSLAYERRGEKQDGQEDR
jgi:hypothetical protein